MSQEEQDSFVIYLRYKNLEDMLKVILFSAQSALGITPMLYHISYNNRQILFIQTGAVGSIIVHYIVKTDKSSKKLIELKRLTGEFVFVDRIGTDTQSLYIPILELQKSTFRFPI